MNCCKSCHFLVRIVPGIPPGRSDSSCFPLTDEERAELDADKPYATMCFKEIWTEHNIRLLAPDSNVSAQLEEIWNKNRKESCFYIKYAEGMTPEGAMELFRLRNDNRQLRKSYRYTQWGLGIAATGAFFAGLENIVKYCTMAINWISCW